MPLLLKVAGWGEIRAHGRPDEANELDGGAKTERPDGAPKTERPERLGTEQAVGPRREIEMRLLEPGDAEACYAAVERDRDYLREWLPWVDRTQAPGDIRTFIETVAIPQYEAGNGPNCGIWVDGEFAGSIGCHVIDWPNRNCSIGYWVSAGRQGKGIVTRCCATLLDYLFDELRLHRVTIDCGTENTRSCAIPERLGFRREGVKRESQWVSGRWLDLVTWSMLDREWRERRDGRLPALADL